jgi:hypothetical protein
MKRDQRRSRIIAILAPAALLLATGCGDSINGGSEAPAKQNRQFTNVQWTQVSRIGGTREDSVLRVPVQVAADSRGFVVGDMYTGKITRHAPSGSPLWVYQVDGTSYRPGGIRDVEIDGDNRTWVLDRQSSRVLVIDSAGKLVRSLDISSAGSEPQSIVPLHDGGFIVALPSTRESFARFGPAAELRNRFTLPLQAYGTIEYIAGQTGTTRVPGSDTWFAGFYSGNGVFAFDGDRTQGSRRWYVEHTDFPQVERVRVATNRTMTKQVGRRVTSAVSLTASPTRLYVLFGGATSHRQRVVDSYSLVDGRYIESFLLPRRASDITWSNGGLFVVSSRPYPMVELIRPIGAELL